MPVRCEEEGCGKCAAYGMPAERRRRWCARHAPPGATNVVSPRCESPGCTKFPTFGLVSRKPRWCAGHAQNGAKNVASKECEVVGCSKRALYGVEYRKPRWCGGCAPPGVRARPRGPPESRQKKVSAVGRATFPPNTPPKGPRSKRHSRSTVAAAAQGLRMLLEGFTTPTDSAPPSAAAPLS